MKTFTYWNNKKAAYGELLFQTVAEDIVTADEQFKQSSGITNLYGVPWISVTITCQ